MNLLTRVGLYMCAMRCTTASRRSVICLQEQAQTSLLKNRVGLAEIGMGMKIGNTASCKIALSLTLQFVAAVVFPVD